MKKFVLACLLLTQAQSQEVNVTVMGQAAPFDVQMLPAGTVQISEGNYYIPNYMNTGISIYVQSPGPLKIATAEETARFQNEWSRFLKKPESIVGVPASPPLASPVSAVPVTAASTPTPASAVTTRPAASPTAPATTLTSAATSTAPATSPRATTNPLLFTRPISTPALPPAAQVRAVTTARKPEAVPPVPSTPPIFPEADTLFGSTAAPATAPEVQPAAAPAKQSPSPSSQGAAPVTTPASKPGLGHTQNADLPMGLRVTFDGSGNMLRYSVMNTGTDTYRLEARDMRILQRGMAVQALLTLRDSVGGTAGTLRPRGAIIGTVEAQTMSKDPLTLNWKVRDGRGKSYNLSYTWTPQ